MTAWLAVLGLAVVHAGWLALAAAAVVGLAFARLGAARPVQRHAVALAALLAIFPAALVIAALPRAPLAASAVAAAVPGPPALSLAPALPWLGLAWSLGVLWGLLGLAVAAVRLARLRRRAHPLALPEAGRLLAPARRHLDHTGPLDLAVSSAVTVPTLLGWRRPLCLLPPSALVELPAGDLEWLLVHELAHVRRADIAWNWAQNLAEVVLFFHPAARWLSRQIRHERECCCDALATRPPGSLAPYVHALTRLASAGRRSPRPALSATGGTLVSRVHRLIDPTAPAGALSRPACLALVLVALAGAAVVAACETEEEATAPRALEVEAPAKFTDEHGVATPVPAGGAWTSAEAQPTMKFIDNEGKETVVPAGAVQWADKDNGANAVFTDDRGQQVKLPAKDAGWTADK